TRPAPRTRVPLRAPGRERSAARPGRISPRRPPPDPARRRPYATAIATTPPWASVGPGRPCETTQIDEAGRLSASHGDTAGTDAVPRSHGSHRAARARRRPDAAAHAATPPRASVGPARPCGGQP